jgi:lysyl endopeptidase
MRRLLALLFGFCAVLATAGVAGAQTHPRAVVRPETAATQDTAEQPQQVGTVESVGKVLDGLGAKRSMTLKYPGASYLKVHFDRLLLLPGDALTVADPSGQESQRITDGAAQWAMSVTGDTAVVTLIPATPDPLALRQRLTGLTASVDKVARGFSASELASRRVAVPKNHTPKPESICGGVDDKRDAVCYRSSDPVAYNRSKAVARLLIDGTELCSGWRVGPNDRMLTNHHCLADSATAQNTEVWFNYECAVCGGFDVLRSTKVLGDQVLATDQTLDYTLFTVQDFNKLDRFGYLDLDVRQPSRGEELYIPQHPGGDPTMMAIDPPGTRGGNCSVADPAYDGYAHGTDVAYYCDTEGGSSGSPVISRETNNVIALHHFGGCPNSGVRVDLLYAQIGRLL